jgi:hypothetical protein
MSYGELPFGCRDCKIKPVGGAPSTNKDLPRIRTVELNVTRNSTDLEADDVTVATHTFAKSLEGSIEAGGINPAVLPLLDGGTVTTTGTTPNRVTTYRVAGTDVENYFTLEAQMYADDGGDLHIVAYKVKATNGPNYSFTQGEFALTRCDLKAIFDDSFNPSRLYDLVFNETVTPIATS